MIIMPTVKTQMNVATPKISKNRLLSDFCLSYKFGDIINYRYLPMRKRTE